jgi:hypothetical protein
MPQEDYLKREIDKLGKILAKALADLLHLKSAAKIPEGIENIEKVFETELNVSIKSLLFIPETEFLSFLVQRKNLNNKQLELIADIFTELADHSEEATSSDIYKRALLIYKYVTENEIDYSIHRHYRIESLTELIRNFNK